MSLTQALLHSCCACDLFQTPSTSPVCCCFTYYTTDSSSPRLFKASLSLVTYLFTNSTTFDLISTDRQKCQQLTSPFLFQYQHLQLLEPVHSLTRFVVPIDSKSPCNLSKTSKRVACDIGRFLLKHFHVRSDCSQYSIRHVEACRIAFHRALAAKSRSDRY